MISCRPILTDRGGADSSFQKSLLMSTHFKRGDVNAKLSIGLGDAMSQEKWPCKVFARPSQGGNAQSGRLKGVLK